MLAIAATQLVPAASASASAAPHLDLASTHHLSTIPVGGFARYKVAISNDGTAETSAPITFDFAVPAGLRLGGCIVYRDGGEQGTGFCDDPAGEGWIGRWSPCAARPSPRLRP